MMENMKHSGSIFYKFSPPLTRPGSSLTDTFPFKCMKPPDYCYFFSQISIYKMVISATGMFVKLSAGDKLFTLIAKLVKGRSFFWI
jgi:hypothetical protein